MKILAFKGKSLISKAIQWQTRSDYSHVGIELSDGTFYEAWHKGGVIVSKDYRALHTPGTPVDVYEPLFRLGDREDDMREFLNKQVGKKYDFHSVARFLSRRESPENGKWFCSELVLVAAEIGGLHLLNIEPWRASPRDVTISPLIGLAGRRVT